MQKVVTAPLPRPLAIPAVNADPPGGYIRPAAGNRPDRFDKEGTQAYLAETVKQKNVAKRRH